MDLLRRQVRALDGEGQGHGKAVPHRAVEGDGGAVHGLALLDDGAHPGQHLLRGLRLYRVDAKSGEPASKLSGGDGVAAGGEDQQCRRDGDEEQGLSLSPGKLLLSLGGDPGQGDLIHRRHIGLQIVQQSIQLVHMATSSRRIFRVRWSRARTADSVRP